MISSSNSVGAVGSESSKHSKHRIALRLFYSLIVFVVGAALLPVVPAAAAPKLLASAPSAYFPVNPTRVLDTRNGTGGVAIARVGPGASVSIVAAPNALAGVPANATAVVMNVTVTNTDTASYLTVYPTGAGLPFASNLNWVPGYTVPNLVTVQPGTGGSVSFYNKFGNTDVIADISGYFAPPPAGPAGQEVATAPTRLVDTRAGSGFLGAGTAVGPGVTTTYQVTGNAGVPAGASAVIVNSTVTNTTAASFLTLWAAGATKNTVSNDNWVAGWTRANRAIVPLSATGQLSVYNQFGSTDVILDVNGYFTGATSTQAGKLFTAMTPARATDHQPLGPNSSFNLSFAGVPAGATAVVLDVVVSETTAPSYLAVYPTGAASNTSDVNWVAGQVNPNLTVTTLSSGGQATFFNSAGNVNVSVDVEGFFGGAVAGVILTANPSSVPASAGVSGQSTLTATVTKADGTAALNDPVNFTTGGGASCGGFTTAPPVNTNGSGVATIIYQASTTPGTCIITATEAQNGLSGTTTITQTTVPNSFFVLTATPSTLAADGVTTSNINSTIRNSAAAGVVGDLVTYTLSGAPSAACGTLASATETTGAAGVSPTDLYTASITPGFCTLMATESATGTSKSIVITQTGTAANTITVAISGTASVPADGTSTLTLTATVAGNSVFTDPVLFTLTPSIAGACGTLSSPTAITNLSGVASVTYTASTTAGTCVANVAEAKGNSNNSLQGAGTKTITQTGVANKIVLTATPATVVADGAATSSLKAVVTKGIGGAAVVGDTVTFTETGAVCAAAPTAVTDASGTATVTYTASVTTGFCSITATDTGPPIGTSNAVTVTQTSAAASAVSVVANPTSVPADNLNPAGRSIVTATVTNSSGGPVPNDPVNFTTSGGAACGTFITANPKSTIGDGTASVTYQASSTVGSCTITATESTLGKNGTASIAQTTVVNAVAITVTTSPVLADGTSTATISSKVTNSLTGNVGGDVVTYTMSGNPSGACGSLSAASATTVGTGITPNVTYTSTITPGFCTVTATEAGTGSSKTSVITQKSTGTNTITVAIGTASVPADGVTTSTLTANVAGNQIANDLVAFTLTPSVTGGCGTLSAASATTTVGGVATVTYTASTTAPSTCVVNVSEANGGSTNTPQAAGTKTITQTAVNNVISLTASPSSIKGDGITTSVVTATVTKGIGGALSGDTVNFTGQGVGNCGTVSATSAVTDASGHATITYTSKLAPSTFCILTATETGTGQAITVTITQTA